MADSPLAQPSHSQPSRSQPALNQHGVRKNWRGDLLSSLVVFLVALPLCMGIALASGAPVATGLASAIIGGLIVGFLAGAPLQVSGPAAGLTVICGEVIRDFYLPALGIVVLVAGVVQLLAGLLRLGQWFRAVSPAVIHGMLSGIGVLILASQLHVMVDDRPRENGVKNIASLPESFWKGLPFPSWEDAPQRRARIEFLQTFGMLHERQGEIERAVERSASVHGSDELHEREQAEIATLAPKQERVIADFEAAVREYRGSPIADSDDERTARIDQAIADAETSLAAALDSLRGERPDQAKQNEITAAQALAGVVAQFKSHDWAAKIGLFSIALIVLWQICARGKLKLVPAPLVAVATATLLAWLFSLPVLYVELPDDLRDGLTMPSWTVLEDVALKDLLVAGVLMAIIASAETLLCATAVDRMHNGPRTRYDRELCAQGIGNMLCGCVGALPMTGVIVRSAANVQAGAKTRLSAILHGVWLLLAVLIAAPLLRVIPTAALAGILVYTGFKLINIKGFFHLWRESRSEALIFLVTLIVIVVEDLLIGVLTGVILSAIKLLVRFANLQAELSTQPGPHGRDVATLSLSGAATFLRLPLLATRLDQVPPDAELHVDLERLDYIDHACLELLTNWAKQHRSTGGRLVVDWDSLHARFRSTGNGQRPSAAPRHDREEVDSAA